MRVQQDLDLGVGHLNHDNIGMFCLASYMYDIVLW